MVVCWASQVVAVVENLPAIQETQEKQIWSLGWEDPLEEGMATHSSILAWKIPWMEIQPVHSKGDQPWVFFGRNDAKAETPVLWPPHAKS